MRHPFIIENFHIVAAALRMAHAAVNDVPRCFLRLSYGELLQLLLKAASLDCVQAIGIGNLGAIRIVLIEVQRTNDFDLLWSVLPKRNVERSYDLGPFYI